MAAADIQAKAKARQLLGEGHKQFEGYRTKTTAELQKMIAAVGKKAPAKAQKSAPVKSAPARKSAPVKSGGKKAPAAKSTPRKSAPVKAAAKGKATRPSTAKAAPAKKAPAKKAAPARKPAAASSTRAKAPAKKATSRTKPVGRGERKPLNGRINWNRETNVGQTGKRKEVLDLLREFKGDKQAVFAKLKRKAMKFYPDKDQYSAERMLVWLIGRVAYDYAYKTGQHENGTRAAYGTSTDKAATAAREKRAAARPKTRRAPARKAAAKPAQARTATRKATPAKKAAPKTAARKPAARKAPAKGTAGRKTKG